MAIQKIILKTAKKKAGSLSRAKIRSVVADVYRNGSRTSGSSKQGSAGNAPAIKTDKRLLLTK